MDLRANRTKSETSGFRRCDIDAFHGMHLSTTPSISLKKKAREKKERTRRCAAETSISSLFLGPKALAPSRINAIGSLVWRLDRSRPFEKDRETRERERKRERDGISATKMKERDVACCKWRIDSRKRKGFSAPSSSSFHASRPVNPPWIPPESHGDAPREFAYKIFWQLLHRCPVVLPRLLVLSLHLLLSAIFFFTSLGLPSFSFSRRHRDPLMRADRTLLVFSYLETPKETSSRRSLSKSQRELCSNREAHSPRETIEARPFERCRFRRKS